MKTKIINNNPGKIPKGPFIYYGENIFTKDKAYKEFYELYWGYLAMFVLIRQLIAIGYDNPSAIITRWEARTKEEVNDYLNFIKENTGITPFEPIDSGDKIQMIRFVCAISHFGNDELPDTQIVLQSWNLYNNKFSNHK